MNSLALLYNAATGGAPLVLGIRMRPVSVGHMVLLHRLESPLVRFDAEPTPSDVALAAYVIADDWRESCRNINSPLRRFIFWLWSRTKWKRADWSEEHRKLHAWLWPDPELAVLNQQSGKPLEAPGCERLLLVLTDAGIPVDQILSMPFSDAQRLVLTWMEAKGHVELNGPNHQALKAAADAAAAKAKEEWEAMTPKQRASILSGVAPTKGEG